MKNLIFFITFIFLWITVIAQQNDGSQSNEKQNNDYKVNIKLSGRCYGDSIILRWGYAEHYAWREVNKAGFIIERLTLDENNNVVEDSFQKLTNNPLKPWSLQEWENRADRNDEYAMAAAQALYGKSFDVADPGNEVRVMQNKADEARNRFSFALFAADLSPQAANGLGLRFVDRNISSGEKYIYKVYSPIADAFFSTDTAMYIIAAKDIYVPAQPEGLKAHEGDRYITLTWPRGLEYTAFHIQRSEDGGRTFKKLNDMPYIRLAKGEGERDFVFIDSLALNYQEYVYRIAGITSFGDVSDWSAPVVAMGRDRTPPAIPTIISTENIADGQVKVTWEMDYLSNDLNGFFIGRSTNVGGPFEPLNQEALSVQTREFTDSEAIQGGLNYYVVASIDTAYNIAQSNPAYVIMPDNNPPSKPLELAGSIDTLGVVKLNWQLGKEPDLKGYRVYYSNTPSLEEDFMVLTKEAMHDTTFTDTITLNTLNEKIYYSVVAVDMNLNNSVFSDILELQKPDTIRPVSPVFKSYEVSDSSVYLEWAKGASNDIAKQVLLKKSKDTDWKEIETFDNHATSYVDMNVIPGEDYQYMIISTDDAGLTSKWGKPLSTKIINQEIREQIKGFEVVFDDENKVVQLKWDYSGPEDCNFLIYRSYNNNGLRMVASANGATTVYTDRKILHPGTYSYGLRAVLDDGRKSPMTKIMTVVVEEQ